MAKNDKREAAQAAAEAAEFPGRGAAAEGNGDTRKAPEAHNPVKTGGVQSDGRRRMTAGDIRPGATIAAARNAAGNPYLPEPATVVEIVPETHNIKSFRVRFDDEAVMENFAFAPGQVGQLGIFGVGESTFAINSAPPPRTTCSSR